MALFRKDITLPLDRYENAEAYYAAIRGGLRSKADHNKRESEGAFFLIIGCTLVAPLFIAFGDGWFFGKLVPAVLAVVASAATAWLQLRKPQRLWALYRRAQRELEREKSAFDFKLGEYEQSSQPETLLAQRVSDIAFSVHEKWEGLVPEPDMIVSNKTSGPHLTAMTANE